MATDWIEEPTSPDPLAPMPMSSLAPPEAEPIDETRWGGVVKDWQDEIPTVPYLNVNPN